MGTLSNIFAAKLTNKAVGHGKDPIFYFSALKASCKLVCPICFSLLADTGSNLIVARQALVLVRYASYC